MISTYRSECIWSSGSSSRKWALRAHFKVHKLEIILNFFYLNQDLICPGWIFQNCLILFLNFCQNFDVRTFSWWLSKWAYVEPSFFGELSKIFFLTLVLLDEFLDCFSKFRLIIVEICILIWLFGVIFENYSMRTNDFIAHCAMCIRWTNFCICSVCDEISTVFIWTSKRVVNACWAHAEVISSHAEHTRNEFQNFIACWAFAEMISLHTEYTLKRFHCMLSLRGTNIPLQIAYKVG